MRVFVAEVDEEQDYNCGSTRLISLHETLEGAKSACEKDWHAERYLSDRKKHYERYPSPDLAWRERVYPDGKVVWQGDQDRAGTYRVRALDVLP